MKSASLEQGSTPRPWNCCRISHLVSGWLFALSHHLLPRTPSYTPPSHPILHPTLTPHPTPHPHTPPSHPILHPTLTPHPLPHLHTPLSHPLAHTLTQYPYIFWTTLACGFDKWQLCLTYTFQPRLGSSAAASLDDDPSLGRNMCQNPRLV